MVRILSDSACDLTREEAAALGVTVIPMHVTLENGEVLRDGIDTDGDTFFTHLATCKKLPTTSQPSPDLFAEAFDAAHEAGDEVVAVLISSELSGTFQSARIGAGMSGNDHIYLIDSVSASIGEGIIVRRACALRDQGLTGEQIADELERTKLHAHVVAVIEDLKNLRKGGRLPAAAVVAGGMLGIRPLITAKDGKVAVVGTARGLPGSYVALYKYIVANGGIDTNYPCIGGWTTSLSQLDPVRLYFDKNLPNAKILSDRFGCVISTHAGIGAFGLAYYDRAEDAPEKK